MGLDSGNVIVHVEKGTTLEITLAKKMERMIREKFAVETENEGKP